MIPQDILDAPDDTWLTTNQLVGAYGVANGTVTHWRLHGWIRSKKIGTRRYLVHLGDFRERLNKKGKTWEGQAETRRILHLFSQPVPAGHCPNLECTNPSMVGSWLGLCTEHEPLLRRAA